MKRLLVLCGLAAILCGVASSHSALAGGDGEKVLICHVQRSLERSNGIIHVIGRMIEVPEDTFENVFEPQGDVIVEEVFGSQGHVGCPCVFTILPNGDIVPGQID